MTSNDPYFFDSDAFTARGRELMQKLRDGTISKEEYLREVRKLETEIDVSAKPLERAIAKLRRKERIFAALIAVIGAIVALVFILIGGTTSGFAQALWVGIGGGVFASAVVAAATPIVAGLWNKHSPVSNEALARSLETINSVVVRLEVLGDHRWAQLADFLNRLDDNGDEPGVWPSDP